MVFSAAADLVPGDALKITLRGVPPEEQQKISGDYTVRDDGSVRLPLLAAGLNARGLTAAQFAKVAEEAYRGAEIYAQPAIEVIPAKDRQAEGAVVSVGGHVKRGGEVPFRQGMTLLKALDAAGGGDQFASRNVILFRGGQQFTLDFKRLDHKNIELKPGDSLQVQQKPAFLDRWSGTDAAVKPLLAD